MFRKIETVKKIVSRDEMVAVLEKEDCERLEYILNRYFIKRIDNEDDRFFIKHLIKVLNKVMKG